MKRNTALTWLVSLVTFGFGVIRAQQPAPAPSFTITAGNITMPFSGAGLIPFTLTSVNGFTGSIDVTCTEPTPPAGVREPVCGGGPSTVPIVLAANATATGAVDLSAYVYFPPQASSNLDLSRHGGGAKWALAGVLMLGFGLRRRRVRRSGLQSGFLLLTIGMLLGFTGISACSAGPVTLTPGVYTYTINASEQNNASSTVITKVQITVPPGIDVQAAPPPV